MGIVRLDMAYLNDLTMIDSQLRKIARGYDDFAGLWDRFGQTMSEVTSRWFGTHGEGTWPPLAEATLKDKARQGYPPDPLIRTGALFDSLLDPSEAGLVESGRSSLGTFGERAFSWGTDVRDEERPYRESYAGFHQEGDGVPERQVIEWPPSPATMKMLEDDANDYVEELLREAGVTYTP